MEALLAVLLAIGGLAVLGSAILVIRKLPPDIRPLALVPLIVTLLGFVVGALALAGLFD